jgi:ankyrin repeat protein
MLYLGPRWLSIASLYLTISNPGRPNISLSFPRIMPPNTEFFICIRSGQRERVKELLTSGEANLADIAAPYDLSVLQLAIVHGQIEIAQFLIAAGASQNPAHYSWTPGDMWDYFAHCSLIQSNMATGAVLVDYMRLLAPKDGTNLFLCSAEEIELEAMHFSRLHKSVLGLSCEKLESIIVHCRNLVNEADSCGRTALYWATKRGFADAVHSLLLCGADPELPDYNGATPLHIASGLGFVECVQILAASGANLESRDRFGGTPLHYACAKGLLSSIQVLLDLGSDYEATNFVGETAISTANHSRQIGAVKYLVERGASLHHIDHWGYNPVLDAAFVDSHEALEFLLAQNSNTSIRIRGGRSILHIAALNSDIKTIEILLNADLGYLRTDAEDDAGQTALQYLRQRKDSAEIFETFCALLLKIETSRLSKIRQSRNDIADMVSTNASDELCPEEFEDALEYQTTTLVC